MRRAPYLLPLAFALGLAAPAYADSTTVSGNQLVLNANTSEDVSIETDPMLHHEVRVSSDNLSCLHTEGGSVAMVNANDCNDRLSVDVAPGTTVVLNASGGGDVHVGNLDGTFTANMSGSGDLAAGRVGALVLALHGSGDAVIESARDTAELSSSSNGSIRLRHLDGMLHAQLNGSGDAVIGTINASAVDVTSNASGDTMIGKGNIGALHAVLHGSGDLVVAATVQTADLAAYASGDIKVARVLGTVHKDANGSATISVMNSDLAEYGIGKLAQVAVDDDDKHSGSRMNHSPGPGFGHFLAGVAALVMLFVIWRTIQRNGGLNSLRARYQAGNTPQPSHPGVLAVRDTITRLEGRLARVEGYVTTREFDLQRKFRELDTKS